MTKLKLRPCREEPHQKYLGAGGDSPTWYRILNPIISVDCIMRDSLFSLAIMPSHGRLTFGNLGVQICVARIAILVSNDHSYLTFNRFVLPNQCVWKHLYLLLRHRYFSQLVFCDVSNSNFSLNQHPVPANLPSMHATCPTLPPWLS